MPKKGNKSKKASNVEIEIETLEEPVPPHCLPEDALVLRKFWNKDESPRDCVPPPTPIADYEFNNDFYKFPNVLPDINELNLPYVREIGVKATIDLLGSFFQCKEYTCNLLQFWFLDVLTASLWITQDDFQFPVELQKVVLSWILYFIDLIRDRSKNITRKQFFKIFKEAILIASEVVEEGCELVPTPNKLILLLEQEEEELVSWSSSSTQSSSGSSLEINQEDFEPTNFIELGDEYRRKYVLPEAKWKYRKHDLSSAASSSESSVTSIELEEEEKPKKKMKRRLKPVEFYQPDLEIPARFVLLKEEETENEEERSVEEEENKKFICKIEQIENFGEETPMQDDVEHVYEVAEKFQVESVAESISTLNDSARLVHLGSEVVDETEVNERVSQEICHNSILENRRNKRIIKNLAIHKLWEQRIADMDDPRKGWIPSDIHVVQAELNEEEQIEEQYEVEEEEEEEEIISSEESEGSVDHEWIDAVINQQNERTMDNEDRQIINYAVIRAIIDIIIKYFYESFQFTLIKMAFQATPEVICQKLNKEWKIPKRIKQGFVRPKDQKPPKAKKAKKGKGKGKGKKGKGKKGKGKKGKDKKSKKGKKDKKKQKPKKLTKEEKAELARLKKEQERLEEEMRKIEENKRFMFPLTDAATDDLFMSIFENWVKVDLNKKSKKGKGKGKGKGKK